MPKYTFQWKDPEFYETCEEDVSDEDWNKMFKLGIGEYIVVEVDTDAGTAKVLAPEK